MEAKLPVVEPRAPDGRSTSLGEAPGAGGTAHTGAATGALHGALGQSGRDLIDDCVHCGFCLPHCPTYQSWGEEMDSPRGRIDLMRGLRDGKLTLSDTVVTHFDRCLGCMACVTACPSGVQYGALIEDTRARIEREHPRRLFDRLHRGMLFSVFPHPARLRALSVLLLVYVRTGLQWVMRRTLLPLLPPRLRQLDALLPKVSLAQITARLPERTPAQGVERSKVGLLLGCVQRVFFPNVQAATARVLAAEGCEVLAPAQGCCGALSLHGGRADEARALTQRLIERLEGLPTIVVNAAGCGSHLKECARLFAGDPVWEPRARAFAAKIRDVHEVLAALPARAERKPLPLRVAYHDACHLAHAQGIRAQPRALLAAIPGLTLLEIPDSEQCCGSAGVYNLLEPVAADQIGERKVANVLSTNPEVLASANPGCTLQLQKILAARGQALRAAHPIELLDASIRGGSLE